LGLEKTTRIDVFGLVGADFLLFLEINVIIKVSFDTDKLCAYRCLSLYNGQSITKFENSTHYYFQKWNAYQHGRSERVYDPKRYPGLQLQEIPEL
jgi:hypothetical protein